jgi:hypothetical protein
MTASVGVLLTLAVFPEKQGGPYLIGQKKQKPLARVGTKAHGALSPRVKLDRLSKVFRPVDVLDDLLFHGVLAALRAR